MHSINFLKRKLRHFFPPQGTISKRYISRFIPDNPIILEAGADTGSDTLEMLGIWPRAKIYAFEPVNESFQKLSQRFTKNNSVRCFNLALSEKEGKQKMYVSNTLSSSSLLKPKEHNIQHPEITFSISNEAETTTIDAWASREGIEKIDFLWLDLQGCEMDVLKSAKKMLLSVKAIYTEVSLIENYEGSALYPEVRKFLEQQGFLVKKEKFPWPDMGNVLFVRR